MRISSQSGFGCPSNKEFLKQSFVQALAKVAKSAFGLEAMVTVLCQADFHLTLGLKSGLYFQINARFLRV